MRFEFEFVANLLTNRVCILLVVICGITPPARAHNWIAIATCSFRHVTVDLHPVRWSTSACGSCIIVMVAMRLEKCGETVPTSMPSLEYEWKSIINLRCLPKIFGAVLGKGLGNENARVVYQQIDSSKIVNCNTHNMFSRFLDTNVAVHQFQIGCVVERLGRRNVPGVRNQAIPLFDEPLHHLEGRSRSTHP